MDSGGGSAENGGAPRIPKRRPSIHLNMSLTDARTGPAPSPESTSPSLPKPSPSPHPGSKPTLRRGWRASLNPRSPSGVDSAKGGGGSIPNPTHTGPPDVDAEASPMKMPVKPAKGAGGRGGGKGEGRGARPPRRRPPPRLPLKEAKQLEAFPTVAPSLEHLTGKTVEGAGKKVVSATISLAFSRGNILDRIGAPGQAKQQQQQGSSGITKFKVEGPLARETKGTPPLWGAPTPPGERTGTKSATCASETLLTTPMPPCGVSSNDGAVSEERPHTIKLPQLVPLQPGLKEVLESNIAVPRALRGEALLGTKATDSRSDARSGTTPSGGAVFHDRNSPLEGLNSPSRLQRRSEENQQDNSFYPNDSKVVNSVVSLQYMDDPWYDYRSNIPQSAASVQEAGSGGSFSCDSAKLTPLQMRNRCGYYSSVLHLNEEVSLTGSELGEGFNNPGNKLRTKAALNRSSLKNTEFCFPRFNRLLFTRSAKIYTPVETLKQTLAELELPYIPELDHRVLSADFNTYKLAEVHGTYAYVIVAMNVLLSYEFVSRFEFSVHKLLNFVKEAFTFFSPSNPLHHPVHAADIIAAVHQWLSQPTVGANLSDEEMLPFLFASIVMRIGHSGWSNHSLTREKHPYSALCCYTAPQQGATVSLTLALLEKPENHFFPSTGDGVDNVEPDTPVMNGDPDCRTPSTLAQTHMWTSEKEDTFYNMVYELIMATDERSYYNIQRSLEQIDQDHYVTHGCICSEADGSSEPTTPTVPLATNPLPKRLNKNCKRCCAYISDAHLPTVMSAVLHILNYSYVFRPYEVFLSGNFSFSASMYRQGDLRVEETQRRRQRQQSRQQAEAKEEQGMGDPTSDSRQTLMPDLTNEVRDLPLHRGSSSSGSSGATWQGASVSMKHEGEAALLKAPQRWREDATPTSTVSLLLLQQSTLAGTTPTVPRPNPPFSHRASQRLSQSVPQPPSQSSQRLSQPSSQPMSQRLSRLMSQRTGDLSTVLAASSVENFADGEMTSSVGDLLPGRSLQRKGRDILLLAFEEIHYPMVQTIQPYVPADWVKKSHLNFTRFLTELPSEEEYDVIVERTLQLCGSSKFNDPSEATTRDDGKPSPLQRLIQAVEEIEIAKYIPFHIIEIAVRPHGTTDVESSTLPSMSREVEVRVLKEIMRSSIEFLALNGASV